MGTIRAYFRQHKWQRWIVTALTGVLLGVAAAFFVYPHVDDWLLIRDLGSRNAGVRERAILRAEVAARTVPRTCRKLMAALGTGDDVQFAAIATALDRAGKLHTPDRDPAVIDRLRAIEFGGAARADTRRQFLAQAIRSRRDNRYNRRLLSAAAKDKAPSVRRMAGLLAATFGDDETLGRLLDDSEASVSASAALDVGLAGRGDLTDRVGKLLARSRGVEPVSSAAYALVRLAPRRFVARVVRRLKSADDAPLRERLLHVLTLANGREARSAVAALLEADRRAGRLPDAMAVLAAGRLGIDEAKDDVRRVLRSLGAQPPPLESQLIAALEAARRLGMPVRAEVYRICDKAWGPDWPFLLIAAARELGRQADMPQAHADAPSREQCVRLLRDRAAFYMEFPSTRPSGGKRVVTTPLPSAAAAIALWRLADAEADRLLRDAAGDARPAPGEYVAWHAPAHRSDEAFALGLKMLPRLGVPVDQRVYNDNERATGAMLLALAASTDEQRRRAAARVRHRLEGGQLGGEDNLRVAATYRCALLTLGREEFLEAVLGLLGIEEIPRRQVIMALCAARRLDGLDWMLCNPFVSDELLVVFYLHQGVGEVLAEWAPALPRIDVCGTDRLRRWQAEILRHAYGIDRQSLKVGRRR